MLCNNLYVWFMRFTGDVDLRSRAGIESKKNKLLQEMKTNIKLYIKAQKLLTHYHESAFMRMCMLYRIKFKCRRLQAIEANVKATVKSI